MSQVLFTAICVILFIPFYYAEKKNNFSLLIIAALLLSFLSGLRDINVGIDTPSYIDNFINDFPYYWKFSEEGFRFISRMLMRVFHNPYLLLLIYSLVTNILIITRLWDYRERCSFSFMIIIYFALHYINTMNIMRQYLAVSVVFFSSKFLDNKKYILYVIAVLLASSIHSSALLNLAIVVIAIWKNTSNKKKFLLLLPLFVIVPISIVYIMRYESVNLQNYLSMDYDNVNIVFFYHVFVSVVAIALQYSKMVFCFSKKERNYEYYEIKLGDDDVLITIMSIIASSFGMFFMYLSRLGIYYAIYEIVFWGRVAKGGRSRGLLILLFSVYMVYYFFAELITNGSGIFPFVIKWFW